MIQLTDINGRTHAIHPDAIARLVEPGTSGKWHGVNCYVREFDGLLILLSALQLLLPLFLTFSEE